MISIDSSTMINPLYILSFEYLENDPRAVCYRITMTDGRIFLIDYDRGCLLKNELKLYNLVAIIDELSNHINEFCETLQDFIQSQE